GATLSSPSVAVRGSNLYIAVRGTDNALDWAKTSNLTFPFSFGVWQPIGGATYTNPTITVVNGTAYIYATGTNGRFYKTGVNSAGDPSSFKIMSGWGQSNGSPLALWGTSVGSAFIFSDPQNDILYQTSIGL